MRGPAGRGSNFARDLAKLAALVLVAGGIGLVLGTVLAQLSDDGGPAAIGAGTGPQPAATTSTATAVARPPATATATATTPGAPPHPLDSVRVTVLDARLFTDAPPSGGQEQPARMTVRIRAENAGDERVTVEVPTLRVGKVRIPADAAGARFDPLPAGAGQTVTLRFALDGEATPKVVRDRRARILIAGQSLAMRVKIRAPST